MGENQRIHLYLPDEYDDYGGYGTVMTTPDGNLYAALEGKLVFESDSGEPYPVDTRLLAQLLVEYNIPFIVMIACQSGIINDQVQNPFASMAAGLLKAGVHSVVAMGYSFYVSGAREFVPAFYERLFSTNKISEAVRAGRERLPWYLRGDMGLLGDDFPKSDFTVLFLCSEDNGTVDAGR